MIQQDEKSTQIDKFFNGIPNAFGIAGDMLTAGFDELGRDCDAILDKVLGICMLPMEKTCYLLIYIGKYVTNVNKVILKYLGISLYIIL